MSLAPSISSAESLASKRPTGINDPKLLKICTLFHEFARSGWGSHILAAKVVHAEAGYVELEMKVQQEHTNPGGTMHGGCISTFADVAAGYAVRTLDLRAFTSLSISTNCIRAIPEGTDVLIRGWTTKAGKRVAFASMDIVIKATGRVAATGEHSMYFMPEDKILLGPEVLSKL